MAKISATRNRIPETAVNLSMAGSDLFAHLSFKSTFQQLRLSSNVLADMSYVFSRYFCYFFHTNICIIDLSTILVTNNRNDRPEM